MDQSVIRNVCFSNLFINDRILPTEKSDLTKCKFIFYNSNLQGRLREVYLGLISWLPIMLITFTDATCSCEGTVSIFSTTLKCKLRSYSSLEHNLPQETSVSLDTTWCHHKAQDTIKQHTQGLDWHISHYNRIRMASLYCSANNASVWIEGLHILIEYRLL